MGNSEAPDPGTDAGDYAKYLSRRDKALATIVLAVDTSILGDPVDSATVGLDNSRKRLGRKS